MVGGGIRKVGVKGWSRGCGVGGVGVRRVGIGGLALRGCGRGS